MSSAADVEALAAPALEGARASGESIVLTLVTSVTEGASVWVRASRPRGRLVDAMSERPSLVELESV